MPETKRFNFTKAALDALPFAPAGKRDTYHDKRQPALTIRVTEHGSKTFRVRGRPRGQLAVETLTIGPFPAVTIEQARAAAADQVAKWSRTESIAAARAESQKQERQAIKFEDALREYVKGKRRGKDGLPLKARTRDDYLQMIKPGGPRASGKGKLLPGELAALASRPLDKITAEDLRTLFATVTEERGQRRGTYSMAVVRAVLNWHGTKVPNNPFDKTIAGKDRIRMQQPQGEPNPIPVERLGAWWRAASAPPAGSTEPDVISDYLRFLLLSGCRSIEAKGAKRKKIEYAKGLRVADVDLVAQRLKLEDTKNRRGHVVLLSRQLSEIVQRQVKGKTPAAPLFALGDVRSRLAAINAEAGVTASPHDLRATFATIAEELVSVYALKRMLNHAAAGDVTDGNYIKKSGAQLRAGWQAVADFIEQLAGSAAETSQSAA
jgi:integrase